MGVAISGLLIAIMVRDGQYMDAMRDKATSDHFPATGKDAPSGRMCGYFIVAIPMLAEMTLAFNQVCTCLK
jgi:hypothetical protein